MHLTATIAKNEITRIASLLTPLRIDLGPKRSVTFGTPELVELAPGTGLRARGDAKLVWDIAGVSLPVTLRAWQLLLVPSVMRCDGALVLAFEPVIEQLDFKRVPGFFDERIIDAINDGVASQRRRLTWNLSHALRSSSPMPARVSPSGSFDITPVDVSVQITEHELRIDVAFDAGLAQVQRPFGVSAAASGGPQDAEATPRPLRTA